MALRNLQISVGWPRFDEAWNKLGSGQWQLPSGRTISGRSVDLQSSRQPPSNESKSSSTSMSLEF